MHNYYLRFLDKAQADVVLNQYRHDVMNVEIVDIGTLYDQVATDQTDEDGNVIYTSTAKEGYHVNIISRYAIEFDESVVVEPEFPRVIFG